MSNYTLLKDKSTEVSVALQTFDTKNAAAILAEAEEAQAKMAYDVIVSEFEKRKVSFDLVDAEKDATDALVTSLTAKRASFITQKASLKAQRDAKQDEVDDKKAESDGFLGAAAVVAPPSAATGVFLLQSELKTKQDDLGTINRDIVTLREQEIIDRQLVESEEKNLAEAVKRRASAPSEDLAAVAAAVADIAAASTALANARAALTSTLADIQSNVSDAEIKTQEIVDKETEINEQMANYRQAESELDVLRQEYDTLVAQTLSVTNSLQDVEGVEAPLIPDTDVVGAPKAGSQLYIATNTQTSVDAIFTQEETLKDALETVKATKKTDLDARRTEKNTAERDLQTATDALRRSKSEFEVLFQAQKKIESDVTINILEDFLKNGNIVLSGAPVVSQAVESEVLKTTPSAKVRSLISRIRASYTDATEYRKLRAEFLADPVGSFYSVMDDPAFKTMSQAEIDLFQNEVKARFGQMAAALFVKYGLLAGPDKPHKHSYTMLIVFGVLLVVAVVAFVVLGARGAYSPMA